MNKRKYGLKLWSINTDFYLDEAKRLFDSNVFDYVELYVVPNSSDSLKKWKKLDIPFDIHAPHYAHGMNLSKEDCQENNKKLYEQVKIYADSLNAEIIVFHGGSGGSYIETARQLKNLQDDRIIIENKPYDTLDFVKEPYYVGTNYSEIKYITDFARCGLCLDVGHAICAANSYKEEPYSFIEKLCTLNPKRIHLSDLDTSSKIDAHLNYGTGKIDFQKLFKILPKNTNITIETNKKSKENLADFECDADFLKKILHSTPKNI